jgi:hypothetical protein
MTTDSILDSQFFIAGDRPEGERGMLWLKEAGGDRLSLPDSLFYERL